MTRLDGVLTFDFDGFLEGVGPGEIRFSSSVLCE
jgi:hypothetical protein